MIYTDDNYIKNIIYKRNPEAHKGNFGKVLIFAGSVGMAGAAVFCARAALKSGAGLVQFLLPDFNTSLLSVLQTSVPEATCVDFSKGIDISGYTSVVAGCGLGCDIPLTDHSAADSGPGCDIPPTETGAASTEGYSEAAAGAAGCAKPASKFSILEYIIDNYTRTLVLDADALNMISASPGLAEKVRNSKARIIITPHIGEARRLLHTCDSISGPEARIRAACELAEKYNCISILKGAGTLVTEHPEIYKNTTGNPGMATGGSGDALAGLIGSLAAQGYSPLDAARAGVFIHGKAGDLAAQELGEMGMTASDIVCYIPYALKMY